VNGIERQPVSGVCQDALDGPQRGAFRTHPPNGCDGCLLPGVSLQGALCAEHETEGNLAAEIA